MQIAQQDRGVDQLSSLDQGQDVAFRAVGRKSCMFNHQSPLNALPGRLFSCRPTSQLTIENKFTSKNHLKNTPL
jgi:hypothetical protein